MPAWGRNEDGRSGSELADPSAAMTGACSCRGIQCDAVMPVGTGSSSGPGISCPWWKRGEEYLIYT